MEIRPVGAALIYAELTKPIDNFRDYKKCLKSKQTKSDNTPYGNEHTQVE